MTYLLRRVFFAISTVFVAASLNFVLFRALPGNAVTGLHCTHCTAAFRASVARQYGLDKPLGQQYLIYLGRLLHGDLGTSSYDNRPVWDDLVTPILHTLPMIGLGTIVSILLGVVVGVIAAWRRGTVADRGSLWSALAFYSAPTQWIGILIVFYIAVRVGLPVAGVQSATLGILSQPSAWAVLVDRLRHMILPAAALGVGLYGQYALIVRSSMLETLGQDYILTGRAKGLPNWLIVKRYGLRNAMLPLVTLIAMSIGYVLAGAIVVETVFSYPGIGLATLDAIHQRDYPVLEGIFLLLTICVVLANLAADLLYARLDPRVRR